VLDIHNRECSRLHYSVLRLWWGSISFEWVSGCARLNLSGVNVVRVNGDLWNTWFKYLNLTSISFWQVIMISWPLLEPFLSFLFELISMSLPSFWLGVVTIHYIRLLYGTIVVLTILWYKSSNSYFILEVISYLELIMLL
jgi:hypothetical protein